MTEAKKRKVHSAEFKAKVGLEAVRGVKTVNEIAQLHGVHPVMVSQWKKEILARAGTLFEGKRGPKVDAAQEDEDRLYGEIGRLKMELDWRDCCIAAAPVPVERENMAGESAGRAVLT